MLSTAGSFSAISALGGPLVARILLLEAGVGFGAALIPVLVPGLVAASIGFLIFTGLGDFGGLDATAPSVPGRLHDGVQVRDLLIAIGVGIADRAPRRGRAALRGSDEAGRSRPGGTPLLLGGALAVGILALLADGLERARRTLFSGQQSIPNLISEDSSRIVLLTAKALAFAVCLGAGSAAARSSPRSSSGSRSRRSP